MYVKIQGKPGLGVTDIHGMLIVVLKMGRVEICIDCTQPVKSFTPISDVVTSQKKENTNVTLNIEMFHTHTLFLQAFHKLTLKTKKKIVRFCHEATQMIGHFRKIKDKN